MSKKVSEESVKRSVTTTAAKPWARSAKTSPAWVATWTCSAGSSPAASATSSRWTASVAQSRAVAGGGEHGAVGGQDRAAAQVGGHLGEERERRLGVGRCGGCGDGVGHLGEDTDRVPRPMVMDHHRRRLLVAAILFALSGYTGYTFTLLAVRRPRP